MSGSSDASFDDSLLRSARSLIADAQRITVLTGAGISTDSGIPDFRGPKGLWTLNPDAERAATLQHYLDDHELRKRSWQNRVKWIDGDPQPNDGHKALFALETRSVLVAVVTQNVDELHQRAESRSKQGFRSPRNRSSNLLLELQRPSTNEASTCTSCCWRI